eukprot:TRINITY_DN66881_c3_g10_i1.p1 TRINITY_DN66881_c3_g10~~TRINITY_DN66881_c3_g10_i1.p1  ORF type:complete len:137 (+),score=28.16 TRINITY_DN66881_c3_g10_i1:79-489(+)
MPSTGITPTDECMAAYVGIKTKRTCRFIEMKISNDNTVIEVVRTGDRQLGWSEFLNELPKDACRYYLYDYQWVNDDGITKDKLLFVNWAPDCCKVREKLLAAASAESLCSRMEGVVNVQGDVSSMSDLDIKKKVSR